MQDLLQAVDAWQAENKEVALATVVKIYGSAPQPLGAKMVISSAGEMMGSVSGGCVEGAVVQEALEVLATHQPKLVPYGISDELATEVGLACGGTIEVYIEPLANDELALYLESVRQARLVAVATVIAGPHMGRKLVLWPGGRSAGSLGDAWLDQAMAEHAVLHLQTQQPARMELEQAPAIFQILLDVQPPPPKLVIIGGVHIAIPLVTLAKTLGMHTVVLDARSAFATPARFSHADQLIVRWPADVLPTLGIDESTYIVVLTHDEKIDDPVLVYACRSPAHYIGALGSRRTHASRVERLKALGLRDAEVARIHAPIGLDLGARRPEEIAVAIMAEIVAVMNGRLTPSR